MSLNICSLRRLGVSGAPSGREWKNPMSLPFFALLRLRRAGKRVPALAPGAPHPGQSPGAPRPGQSPGVELSQPLFSAFQGEATLCGAESSACQEGPVIAKTTLFDLVTGDRARIVKIHGSGKHGITQRLLDMGVVRGTEIRVERHAPLGDPVEVRIKGYLLALRMSEAKDIEVEVL